MKAQSQFSQTVLTLQQIVLSKNQGVELTFDGEVLTLQQIVLSKNTKLGL